LNTNEEHPIVFGWWGCTEEFGHEFRPLNFSQLQQKEALMYNIVYLVGAVVIVLAVLSFFGMR